MASALSEWKDDTVCVITCDGRFIQGILAGYDQLQNLILRDAQERVYQLPREQIITTSSTEGPIQGTTSDVLEIVPLGLYMIRGDNVAIVSDVREQVLEQQETSGYAGFENGQSIKPIVQQACFY